MFLCLWIHSWGSKSQRHRKEKKSSKNIHKSLAETFLKYNEPLKVLDPWTQFSVSINVCVGVYVRVKLHTLTHVYGGRKLTKRMSSIAFDVFFGECASLWMYSLPIAKKGWLISLRDLPVPLRNPCQPLKCSLPTSFPLLHTLPSPDIRFTDSSC